MQWLGSTVLRTCVRVMKPAEKLLLTTNLVGYMHEFYSVRCMLTGAGFEPLEVVTDTLRMRCADGSSFLESGTKRLLTSDSPACLQRATPCCAPRDDRTRPTVPRKEVRCRLLGLQTFRAPLVVERPP